MYYSFKLRIQIYSVPLINKLHIQYVHNVQFDLSLIKEPFLRDFTENESNFKIYNTICRVRVILRCQINTVEDV